MADAKENESPGCTIIFYGFWIGLAVILLYYPLRSVWLFFTEPNLIPRLVEMIEGFGICCGGFILFIGFLWFLRKFDSSYSDSDESVKDHNDYY